MLIELSRCHWRQADYMGATRSFWTFRDVPGVKPIIWPGRLRRGALAHAGRPPRATARALRDRAAIRRRHPRRALPDNRRRRAQRRAAAPGAALALTRAASSARAQALGHRAARRLALLPASLAEPGSVLACALAMVGAARLTAGAPLQIVRRASPPTGAALSDTLHPVLQRIYAARGIVSAAQLGLAMRELLPIGSLDAVQPAAELLATHQQRGGLILVIGG